MKNTQPSATTLAYDHVDLVLMVVADPEGRQVVWVIISGCAAAQVSFVYVIRLRFCAIMLLSMQLMKICRKRGALAAD
jgi:hypothetical protein